MKKILIFGGTTEGRIIAETLSKNGIFCDVRVATEYGQQVMNESENLIVSAARLSVDEMTKLCETGNFSAVIDATHPFAQIVSQNIKSACGIIPLLRFERQTAEVFDGVQFFNSTEECIHSLLNTTGKILLTTGSKDLFKYCQTAQLKPRLVARVLPGMESLKLCYDLGLEGRQIIAMQGPFSREMNAVQLKDYGISILVTKESGKTGGVDQKILAAKELGIKIFVIRNPNDFNRVALQNTKIDSTYKVFYDFNSLYSKIEEIFDVKIKSCCNTKIILAGIGPGNANQMTVEVQNAVCNSDYIFGAERMISEIKTSAKKLPYYLAKDIVPLIQQIQKENKGEVTVTVLFSGDTGFYSGQLKLRSELELLKNIQILVLPGLSSMQVLAAKAGISWHDSVVISMHGVKKDKWLPELKEAVNKNHKIFLLTSGLEDVQTIGNTLIECGFADSYNMIIGYNLSYSNEKIIYTNAKNYMHITEKGLYSVFLISEESK